MKIRAFKRAIDEVCTLPQTPPKGGSKSKYVIFVNKNQFKSNKLCYKVSLCKNFQQHSCSRTIPLSNYVYTLAVNVTLTPQRVAQKANSSFKNRFPYRSVTDEASNSKFGMQLGFAKAHHKIPVEEKVGVALG